MKLVIKEEKYDLSWKEHDVKMIVDGEMGTYPSYAKRVGNLVVNIDPEVFNNGEFGYTVYYTPHIGQAGFKKAESGFMNSSEAMDYADTYIFGASDFVDPFWESKSRRNRSTRKLREQDVEIEVKNKGILEVPEGKNVDDLPMSHFEKLAKKKGLGKITKALNNLQVWNKNDDPKLSKWAGDMIDKLNKKLKKDESWYERIPVGYKWRNIVIPSDDDFEAEIEEYIADLKSSDDKIEWDTDYHGGMFGDDRVISLYSSGEDYTDVKYKVTDLRDTYSY